MSDGPADHLTVSSDVLGPFQRLAAEAGIPFSELEPAVDSLVNPGEGGSLRLVDYFRMLERLSLKVQDETCKVSTRPLLPGTTTFVLSHLAECERLYEALKLIAKTYNLLHGGAFNRVEERGDDLVYAIDDSGFPYARVASGADYSHFVMECVLIFLHSTLVSVTSEELSGLLRKVYSKRPSRKGAGAHLQFWDVPIRWRSGIYGLVYDRRAIDLPIRTDRLDRGAMQSIYSLTIDYLERRYPGGGASATISERVSALLHRGVRTQAEAARMLGMSVPTLRRRLDDEDSSFRDLRRRCLNERAKSMLRRGVHISAIAEELGFSDFRSFTRAFKDWNRQTPAQFARRNRM